MGQAHSNGHLRLWHKSSHRGRSKPPPSAFSSEPSKADSSAYASTLVTSTSDSSLVEERPSRRLAPLRRTREVPIICGPQSASPTSRKRRWNDQKAGIGHAGREGVGTGTRASERDEAFQDFLRRYPEYQLSGILDDLRKADFTRLESSGEVYLDYMGGALYPESLVHAHTRLLTSKIFGNTHSVNPSSKLSLQYADEARAEVLSFFDAPLDSDYTVVFTANASAALKLVGEAYPFTEGSSLVLGVDSHNSVHGIREYTRSRGGKVVYIPSTPHGGFVPMLGEEILIDNAPVFGKQKPSLFVLTGQSNISNSKISLDICTYASSLGYHTVLDAAALAPTSIISLTKHPVDAMVVSFYKMFGYPTGVGALIVKKKFLALLERPWFAGGTVEVVQVPGTAITRAHEYHEQFEDGTINYLTLPAITNGLRFLKPYLPFIPLRLTSLLHYLISSLETLRHEESGSPVVQVLSRQPSSRLSLVGEQSDVGGVISLLFQGPSGAPLPNSFIEDAAARNNISLRTGCVCNPGGAAAMLGMESYMEHLTSGATHEDFEAQIGRELGVLRISLGLVSNFEDVWRFLTFAKLISQKETRTELWEQWVGSRHTK